MKTTRKTAGIYAFTYKGHSLEVENMAIGSDGETHGWFVFVIEPNDSREFVNDYNTKRYAIERTIQRIDAGEF